MIYAKWSRSKHIHFFNFLSIYWCDYLKNQTHEYWAQRGFTGRDRSRVFKLGKLTVWIRAKNDNQEIGERE